MTSSSTTGAGAFDREELTRGLAQLELTFLKQPLSARKIQIEANEARTFQAAGLKRAADAVVTAKEELRSSEEAKNQALQEAAVEKDSALRQLKRQIALLLEVRSEIAGAQSLIAERRNQVVRDDQKKFVLARELVLRVEAAESGEDADALYLRFGKELDEAADRLSEVIDFAEERVDLPEVGTFSRNSALDVSHRELQKYLEERKEVLAYRERILSDEKEARRAGVAAWHYQVDALLEGRAKSFSKVSNEAFRNAVVPIFGDALREVFRELHALRLSWASVRLLHGYTITHIPELLRDFVTLGKTFWILAKLFIVVVAISILWRRSKRFLDWGRGYMERRSRTVVQFRRVRFYERSALRFRVPALALLSLVLTEQALGDAAEVVEVALLLIIFRWMLYYFLFDATLTTLVFTLVRQSQLKLSNERRLQIEQTSRWLGRTFLAYGLVQSVALRVLRSAVLFFYAKILLLSAVLIVVMLLLRKWRLPIAQFYVERWPEGRLADWIAKSGKSWTGVLVTGLALILVVAEGLWDFARNIVFSLEHTRRLLAFLFRKRLERKAEKLGGWTADLASLPPTVQAAFTFAPVTEDAAFRHEYFPGLDKLKQDVETWKLKKSKGSFLVRGARGYGKTSWVFKAREQHEDLDPIYVNISRKGSSAADLVKQLGESLALEDVPGTEKGLRSALSTVGGRMIILDNAHRLYYRRIGGGEAFDALMRMIEDTSESIFWLVTTNELTHRYVCAARPRRMRFRSEVHLRAWPENELRDLLLNRAVATGVRHEFQDLVVSNGSMRGSEALEQAGEDYTRLLWDYSDGCPLVALHFWLESLAILPDGGLRVRLFRGPDTERFEEIPEEATFVYAAVMAHEGLTAKEASEVTGYERELCVSVLDRAIDETFLEEVGGRYRVQTHWLRVLTRFLRVKQVL